MDYRLTLNWFDLFRLEFVSDELLVMLLGKNVDAKSFQSTFCVFRVIILLMYEQMCLGARFPS